MRGYKDEPIESSRLSSTTKHILHIQHDNFARSTRDSAEQHHGIPDS
jgi:hypothetical protein